MSNLSSGAPFPEPKNWQLRAEMARETTLQVQKDFALHGLNISLENATKAYPDLVKSLAEKLDKMRFIEHLKLPAILYQIDLNEREMVLNLQNLNPQETYFFLADRILKRCFEKVYWRHKMKGD